MIFIKLEHVENDQTFYVCEGYQITNAKNISISNQIQIDIWFKREMLLELMQNHNHAPTTEFDNEIFSETSDHGTESDELTSTNSLLEVTSQGQTGCPPSFGFLGEGCYHTNITLEMTWIEAASYCNGKSGSKLAHLTSQDVRSIKK